MQEPQDVTVNGEPTTTADTATGTPPTPKGEHSLGTTQNFYFRFEVLSEFFFLKVNFPF